MDTPFVALIILFVFAPAIVIFLEGKYSILKKIGAVSVCYGIGIVIGNMGILPDGSAKYQSMITEITIPLSLPLILFSMDVKKWFKNAGSALGSLLIGLVSVLIVIFFGFWLLSASKKTLYFTVLSQKTSSSRLAKC